ncbi:glycosyltransferase family 2 protein [Flavobacterium hibisci]|uniref:glycosyltransferase family 2 protein n=1 Tax=Flavobacterium hibisci TaxID=1914462 RepID=UPI001CBEFA06|nr:glycosyltransferase [Flavobacterium hibisci]MBZ4043052.1 glycosyltransferase [Flavobacterium hibisci]
MVPQISVIIPLYNKEDSIKATVDSVLNQAFKNFELLIIDDGSTDNSLKVLSEFDDDRIKIVTKKNGGVSEARNYGVEISSTEYIFFLDADDIISDFCLSVFIDLIEKYKNASVFVANFKVINPDQTEYIYCKGREEFLVKNNFKALWDTTVFPRTGSMVVKKSCFLEVGFFNTDISLYEDLELILRLFRIYKIAYSPKIVLNYICEFNTLSKKLSPLKREFSYYADYQDKGFYEKLIISEVIYKSYKKRVKYKDTEASQFLKNKFNNFYIYIIIAFLSRKKINFIKKVNAKFFNIK